MRFTDRKVWGTKVQEYHPEAKIFNDGTYLEAYTKGVLVGVFSIIGQFGWVE